MPIDCPKISTPTACSHLASCFFFHVLHQNTRKPLVYTGTSVWYTAVLIYLLSPSSLILLSGTYSRERSANARCCIPRRDGRQARRLSIHPPRTPSSKCHRHRCCQYVFVSLYMPPLTRKFSRSNDRVHDGCALLCRSRAYRNQRGVYRSSTIITGGEKLKL